MLYYISATGLSIFFAALVSRLQNTPKVKKLCMVLSTLPLFFLAAFRYDVGTDYLSVYVPGFNMAVNGMETRYELSFNTLQQLLVLFTSESAWLFFICAALISLFIYVAIFQQSTFPVYSILLLVLTGHYFDSLNLMRQFIAIAIFLYAVKYIKRQKLFPYILLIVFGATFHYSILFALPLFYIGRVKLRPMYMLLSIIIIFVCQSLLVNIVAWILSFTKYAAYYQNSQYNSLNLAIITILINVAILCVFLYFYKQGKDNMDYRIYLNMQWIACLLAVATGIFPLAYRIIYIATIVQIISIPNIIRFEKNKYVRFLLYYTIFIVLLLNFYYSFVIHNYNNVLPYQTIFGA